MLPDMKKLARMVDDFSDASEEGFFLELIKGGPFLANGDCICPGERFRCFIRAAKEGDICAYFDTAFIPEGTRCGIAPYDFDLSCRFISLPVEKDR